MLQDDAVWKALCERKWGPWVPELARVEAGQWKAYAMHRINFESLPRSPLDLVQEQYPDPWQHLVSGPNHWFARVLGRHAQASCPTGRGVG
jgi:hypothetical protein